MAEAKGKKEKKIQATDEGFLKQLGSRIRELRQLRGLTQQELAYRIGMEKSNLSVIENGKSNPQILTLVRLSSALEASLGEMLQFEFDYMAFMDAPGEYVPRKHGK